MRRWKWLTYLCPWFNVHNNPDCETCEFYYVISPKNAGFCLWNHELITITDKNNNSYRTPMNGICRDYRDNRE